MNFYTFSQSNPGGWYDVDDTLCHYVIVEAASADEANRIAVGLGVYFDGCDRDIDCPCCGDRWYPVSDDEATSEPLIYGTAVDKVKDIMFKPDVVYARVFMQDGTVREYRNPKPKKKSKKR